MDNFRQVIDQWPSLTLLATDTGTNYERVRKWRHRDNIPADAWKAVLKAAKRRRYPITATALIDLASRDRVVVG